MNLWGWIFPFIVVIDPLLNQYAMYSGIVAEGSVILQTTRLIILILVLIQIFNKPMEIINHKAFIILFILLTSVFLSAVDNGVSFSELVVYSHIAYWVLTWLLAEKVCENEKNKNRLEKAIIIESFIVIISVIAGLVFGYGLNFYSAQGVVSSAGYFNTAKTAGITACLGFFLFTHRYGKERPQLSIIIFIFSALSVEIMQARAGILAFAIAILWLISRNLIRLLMSKKNYFLWGILYFALCVMVVVGLSISNLISIDSVIHNAYARWPEINSESAGSFRKYLWSIALTAFGNANLKEKIVGIGLHNMYANNGEYLDMEVHTHNDLFDALLIGGVIMLVALLMFWRYLINESFNRKLDERSQDFAMAIVIMFIVNGFFTGYILQASDVFSILAAWTCITVVTKSKTNGKLNIPGVIPGKS